jgi:hypothetical protein
VFSHQKPYKDKKSKKESPEINYINHPLDMHPSGYNIGEGLALADVI